jgi:maltose-binding protein MalE
VMTASLEAASLPVEIMPMHPKMGALIKVASEMSATVLEKKRNPR